MVWRSNLDSLVQTGPTEELESTPRASEVGYGSVRGGHSSAASADTINILHPTVPVFAAG